MIKRYDEQELQALVHRALSRRQFLGRTAFAAGGLAPSAARSSPGRGDDRSAATHTGTHSGGTRNSSKMQIIAERLLAPSGSDVLGREAGPRPAKAQLADQGGRRGLPRSREAAARQPGLS
jgi:hypothetical protein